jgi:nucleotide-binding universal stress UspA family protein
MPNHAPGGARTGAPAEDGPGTKKPPAPHVLVCLDRSALAESVLPHALALARSCGGRLTFLHVLEPDHRAEAAPVDPLEWQIHSAERRQYVDALAARHRTPELAIDSAVIQGHAAEQIRAWGAQHRVDFTVLCSHGEGGCTEWTLASTAQKLIEGVPGSVLLVPATAAGPAPERYERVLVPVDGSTYGESALPMAIRIVKRHKAELILAHVVPVPELTRVGPFSPEDLDLEERLVRRNEAVGRAYLERLRTRLAESGVDVRTVITRNTDARAELVRIVERERVQLVVLSAHGRSGRVDEPCGSVAAHLLAHCMTPVLVVRERRRAVARRRDPLADRRRASARMPALAAP